MKAAKNGCVELTKDSEGNSRFGGPAFTISMQQRQLGR
jgi:hypothetical protein